MPEVSLTETLESALAKDFALVQDVRHVLTDRADGNLLVWIAIDNYEDFGTRRKVYEKELSLIEGFPEINFDFNLFPSNEKQARDLATSAQVVYSRE